MHALQCMHYDENLCKEPHLCPEVTNIWEHKQCSFFITSKQLDTSVCQGKKSRYLWETTKFSAMNFRKDYFLIKCAFLLSISSMAVNTVSTCWLVSSSDINNIVDLSLETKIWVFLMLENWLSICFNKHFLGNRKLQISLLWRTWKPCLKKTLHHTPTDYY